jgi:hypothetical protein
VDGELAGSDAEIANLVDRFYSERLRPSERHPDMWHYAVVREPGDVEARLARSGRQVHPSPNERFHRPGQHTCRHCRWCHALRVPEC